MGRLLLARQLGGRGSATPGPWLRIAAVAALASHVVLWPVLAKTQAVDLIAGDTAAESSALPTLKNRYRLYSPVTLEHHYTTDLNEYLVLGQYGWIQEGVSSRIYDGPATIAGHVAVPYYRLYDFVSRWHLWTTDLNEYDTLRQFTFRYVGEGIDGYIFRTPAPGTVPWYRLAYPFVPGLHHWTADQHERDTLVSQYGWVEEQREYVVPAAAVSGSDSSSAFTAIVSQPSFVASHFPTDVTVTARFRSGAALIGSSVALLRYDAAGDPVGSPTPMFDDGTHGDLVSFDGAFATTATINELGPNAVLFRVSASFANRPAPVLSVPVLVPITADDTPLNARTQLAAALRAANRSAAYARLGETFSSSKLLDPMTAAAMTQVAAALETCAVTDWSPAFEICETTAPFGGQPTHFEFFVFRDAFGVWRVISW